MAGINRDQRIALFEKLREDEGFRSRMKTNWRTALEELGIDADAVKGGILKRSEIEEFAQQSKGVEVEVEISARGTKQERVEVKEALIFEKPEDQK